MSFHILRLGKSESKKKGIDCYKNAVCLFFNHCLSNIMNPFQTKYLSDIQCRKPPKNYCIWLKFHTAKLPKIF